jgi:hypothetical protein
MKPRSLSHRLELATDQLATVPRRRTHQRVRVACGSVWLTVDGEPDDHVLSRGDEWVLRAGKRALVQALDAPARVLLQSPSPAHPSAAAAWAAVLDALRGAWQRTRAVASTAATLP